MAAVTAVALPASLLTTWLLLRSPLAARLVATPRGDRWHVRATPLLGGIGIAAGLAAGLGVALATGAAPATRGLAGIAAGRALRVLAGLLDAPRGPHPIPRRG